MESLFVYGTLQEEKIQKAIFGRRLHKRKDLLKGYEKFSIRIPDNASGTFYPAVKPSTNKESEVPGMVLSLQEKDLLLADRYEGDSYHRKKLTLESGTTAWAYLGRR